MPNANDNVTATQLQGHSGTISRNAEYVCPMEPQRSSAV